MLEHRLLLASEGFGEALVRRQIVRWNAINYGFHDGASS
jgi:hypothetical protein